MRLWHGLADRDALDLARAEHSRIYEAIAAGDANLARAAMLLHIAANEAWLHAHLAPIDDGPLHDDDDRESSQQQADLNPSSIGPA